eukprot:TRINITY_DN22834_c0_g1_i1.p1 TRINITY_DN22834_c0_g1~~TRINITY_DN22834_c0_g1_i1.p1  ORF type:complete len:844 (-),score=126.32 TRINITY_DN22834_c0_g1_i1:98-2629(-)
MVVLRRASSPSTIPASIGVASNTTCDDNLVLSRLCHSVTVGGVLESLRIRLSDIQLPNEMQKSVEDMRCKVYIGPATALRNGPDGRMNKAKFRVLSLDMHHEGVIDADVHVGSPCPSEPWAIRLKLFKRPAHALFKQEKIAEVVQALPFPSQRVKLAGADLQTPPGSALLEVVRIVPRVALAALQERFGVVLCQAVDAGADEEDVGAMCDQAIELGCEALLSKASEQALVTAASAGRTLVLLRIMDSGVPPTAAVARAAEEAGYFDIALGVLLRVPPLTDPAPLLAKAMKHGLPLLAEYVLMLNPGALDELSSQRGETVKQAHAAGAWSVLAAMLNRGDPPPVPVRLLLNYALRAGHAGLARACLLRYDDLSDMQSGLKTCLDDNRLEIVREALEAQWIVRASHWSLDEGPALLSFECGRTDDPSECPVCFDPLHPNPGVLLDGEGLRVCGHFICEECAQRMQDEAAIRHKAWRMRRDRYKEPPGPACPLCRSSFVVSARLPDPTVDPRSFFRLACLPRSSADDRSVGRLRLTEQAALTALCALLPINSVTFAPRFKQHLWPAWCGEDGALEEPGFLKPGGMLAWLSDHLLESKVEEQLGDPPSLHEARAWFEHFDYDGRGRLTKPALLRGVAKAHDMAGLACPTTPAHQARKVGVQKLRDLVEAVWDDALWADGVPLEDFVGTSGLATRLLAVLPDGCRIDTSMSVPPPARNVDEALAKARTSDFGALCAKEACARRRAEARLALSVATPVGRQSGQVPPWRPGPAGDAADVFYSNLLELSTQSRFGTDRGRDGNQDSMNLHVRCPFCSSLNTCRGTSGHRVICGNCRAVFEVPDIPLTVAI